MKVALLSTIYPHPIDFGKKVVLSGMLSYLTETFGAKNVTYILIGSLDEGASQAARARSNLIKIKPPRIYERVFHTAWHSLIKREKSIQESMLFSIGISKQLHKTIQEIQPDIVICDTIRIGQYFEGNERFSCHYILYMDDLFSLRYEKMLEAIKTFPDMHINPLGNFESLVPRWLRPLVSLKSIQTRLLRLEKDIMRQRERQSPFWFESSLLVNDNEVTALRKVTGLSTIRTLRPLITPSIQSVNRRFTGDPVFIFLGALNYPPNDIAIVNFIKEHIATIIETIPGFKLIILGKGASPELIALANQYNDAISIEGFVPDLSAYFSKACATIVPLLFGSGVKIKIIEAFSYGIPVITTGHGIDSIPARNGVECFIENDLRLYPGLMQKLCDLSANQAISKASLEFFEKFYGKQSVFMHYQDMIGAPEQELCR